jgi:PIN domain nuclease of toxin-antitoxin system
MDNKPSQTLAWWASPHKYPINKQKALITKTTQRKKKSSIKSAHEIRSTVDFKRKNKHESFHNKPSKIVVEALQHYKLIREIKMPTKYKSLTRIIITNPK